MIAKNSIEQLNEEQIDELVTNQAEDESVWEEPTKGKLQSKSTNQKNGLVELLFEPEDLKWLVQKLDYPTEASSQEKAYSARIRFRALMALQKAGLLSEK